MTGATGTGFRLGIDFGTSHTTAILRWPDGHVRPLLFDGSPLLPSAVYADTDGTLLVGRDAVHAARLDPGRFEPSPKRRIDRDSVQLGDRAVPVTAMIAAVLGRVRDEAVRVSGARVDDLTLTHPAGWTGPRLAKLTDACREAGLPDPATVAEPVAAAGYFVSVLGRTIPSGSALVVYDFGGGTFDASAVTPAHDGYRVLAMAGIDNLGGVDLDAALLEFVATVHRGQDAEAWQRLEQPQTPADRRHRRHLVEDVRAAKEMLSRAPSATIPVPLLELEARVSREEFDALARPLLERTVSTTADVIRSANLPPERIAAVLLVGGSSRIPLVADLLRQGTGIAPSTIDQPETVVAEGSIRLSSGASGATRAASAVPAPPAPAPTPVAPGALGPPVDPWASHEPPTEVDPPTPTPTPTPIPVTAVAPVIPPQWTPPAYERTPPRTYTGALVKRRRRRLWIPAVAVVVLLLAGAATAVVLRPEWLRPLGLDLGPSSALPYVRANPPALPAWLPAGWKPIVDDELRESIMAGDATNGGTCTYVGSGRIRVQRDQFDVSGCKATQEIKDMTVRDVAVEAEMSVVAGCGGLWVRTGTRGYFLAVCSDQYVRLHLLGATSAETRVLIKTVVPLNPAKVVVGLVAQGQSFTVYVDGKALDTVKNAEIAAGRLGVGGFAPYNVLDATIIQYRAWAPAEV